jgi:hypothetical protein
MVFVWNGSRYATPLLALQHAVSATFTLQEDEQVDFGLNDCHPGCSRDNRGGLTVAVTELTPTDRFVLGQKDQSDREFQQPARSLDVYSHEASAASMPKEINLYGSHRCTSTFR